MVIIKLAQEIIDKIPVLYGQLGSQKAVAEELGISTASVRKYLNLFQATANSNRKKTSLDEETILKINERYSETRNLSLVSREFGISTNTVRANLTEDNLALKDQEMNDRDVLFFYIYKLFGRYSEEQAVSPWNLTQMQKFKAQGMPYRGQFLTLKYFYEVLGNTTEKSKGSIGIIPFKFAEAAAYYKKKALKSQQLTQGIIRQLEKDRIEININPADYFNKKKKGKKKEIDLTTIEGEEE